MNKTSREMQTEVPPEPLPTPAPGMDLARIAFPSDKITLADLRRVHAKEFDARGRNFFDGPKMGRPVEDWPQEALSDMLSIERLIARMVFESARQGKPQASLLTSRWEDDIELVDLLSRYYMRYGLARGPQDAWLLIGSIEEQATKLAADNEAK